MAAALLIADYIIGTSAKPLTPMQVNKLAYISHGFTLAFEDAPLFSDKVEAWRWGPVIPSIYHELKHYGGGIITSLQYCGTILNTPQAHTRMEFLNDRIPSRHVNIINQVLDAYGHISGRGLSTITHEKGTPWHQCYKTGNLGIEIPDSLTKAYYKSQI